MLKKSARLLLILFAAISLAIGIVGVFVPGLPTTVFVLMAAWAAARSSPKFAAWLESYSITGPLIRQWKEGRYVPRKAKYAASLSMLFSALIMGLLHVNIWLIVVAGTCMLMVLIWLWSRPEPMRIFPDN
jgi:uncharacterized membrane protein YbaN (DUF454 family)